MFLLYGMLEKIFLLLETFNLFSCFFCQKIIYHESKRFNHEEHDVKF